MRKEIYWLIFILLLAVFLRLYQLEQESLWTDEAFSTRIASQPSFKEVVLGVAQTEAAPPGYYVLLHYWRELGGDSVFMLRLLSVFLSVGAIVLLFLLVRMLLNTKVALIASLFMATSMLQIEYAQEARLYALFTFLSLSSIYFFVQWYKETSHGEAGKSTWFWYALCTLLALYVNYMAVFLMLGCSLFLVSRKSIFFTCWKKWLAVQGIILVLCLPLLPLLQAQFHTLNTGLPATLLNKGVPSFLAQLGLFLFVLPVLAFTVALALVLSRKEIRLFFLHSDRYFFSLILLMGLAYSYVSIKSVVLQGIPFIRVPITNSFFLVRHSFFLVPLWYVYLGYKVDQYFNRGRKYFAAFIIVIVLFFSFFSLHQYYAQPTKAQWREAAHYIAERNAAEQLILLDKGGGSNEFLLQYYYPRKASLFKLRWSDGRRNLQQISDEEVLAKLKDQEGSWLVLARNIDGRYKELLEEHYREDFAQDFYGVKVYHYTAKEAYFPAWQ